MVAISHLLGGRSYLFLSVLRERANYGTRFSPFSHSVGIRYGNHKPYCCIPRSFGSLMVRACFRRSRCYGRRTYIIVCNMSSILHVKSCFYVFVHTHPWYIILRSRWYNTSNSNFHQRIITLKFLRHGLILIARRIQHFLPSSIRVDL